MMLSRIAESLFWIGRYLERAEDTCRILDVHLQMLVEEPTTDEEESSHKLLRVMGAPAEGAIDTDAVMRILCYDPASPCSIVAAVGGVRESARRARETVSTEMWEAINTTWNGVNRGQLERLRPQTAFRHVRERCAVISGMADGTMSHDEGWQFLVLGRSVERTDMTARLITTAAFSAGTHSAWMNVLRGCGADHAFVRAYGGTTSDRDAAEFLLLDRLFPRSVVHSLTTAITALANLDVGERRAGFEGDAARLLGIARGAIEYRPPEEILADLPRRMTELQDVCSRVTDAITERYFSGAIAAQWHGGSL